MVGQPIESLDRTVVGNVAIFTLDRNLTSMATRSFDEAPVEPGPDDFAAILAGRIFGADREIDRVYIAANAVQVTRSAGWSSLAGQQIGEVIAALYRFYD